MNKVTVPLIFVIFLGMLSCTPAKQKNDTLAKEAQGKVVVYQVFTRLFGNEKTLNKPWGTIEENGVGKFEDFTDKALQEIKNLGVTHIWYTGVLHHATITDYTKYGIENDDPDVVKGRAGSPYAVKDYYQVNPDLAVDPNRRLEEFEALVERSHNQGLKVIIDIVPNHIARAYKGMNNPKGVVDFGTYDDISVAYRKNNNFYYVPDQNFKVPEWKNDYQPLGGEAHPKSDRAFHEQPAKWTGNGSRLAQPNFYDWYETVKINYGVSPEGNKDFDELSKEYSQKNYKEHFEFWKDKEVPDSWIKFRDIALFWIEKGIDGFRFDMAEMVPVEFWSYMNSSIKMNNEDAFLLAEVYNPALYRDYIHLGKMDYLYDKVALYDTIKHIVKGHGLTDNIPKIQEDLKDIEHHMLHFLENHDEQRIASPDFAGKAEFGKPAMLVSTTISSAPTMVYFGQEVGEPGNEDAGFGTSTRTSIFDYVGVPNHQKWVNNKLFDGGQLSEDQKHLRDFYKRLLNFSLNSEALMNDYEEIHSFNRSQTNGYDHRLFSFVRWSAKEQLIVVTNFDTEKSYNIQLKVPDTILKKWNLSDGNYSLEEELYHHKKASLKVSEGLGTIQLSLSPLDSYIFRVLKE